MNLLLIFTFSRFSLLQINITIIDGNVNNFIIVDEGLYNK